MKKGVTLFKSAAKIKEKVELDLTSSFAMMKTSGLMLSPTRSPASSDGDGSNDSFNVTVPKHAGINPFKQAAQNSLNWRGFSTRHIIKVNLSACVLGIHVDLWLNFQKVEEKIQTRF